MPDVIIEQAICASHGYDGWRLLSRSPGFIDEWISLAEDICVGFGESPANRDQFQSIFAQPFGELHVATVQVVGWLALTPGLSNALGFRFLVIPRRVYAEWIGDPFVISESFPPDWQQRDPLPGLTWPAQSMPPRTVMQLQQVLKSEHGPMLLGAVQALLDGGRVVFERSSPEAGLLQKLWMLLPNSTRGGLWPASFAFGNDLQFDALIVPCASGEAYAGYLSEQQVENYPHGRYEHNLQVAIEAGDQDEVNRLFARRSRSQANRLILTIMVLALCLLVGMKTLELLTPAQKRANKAQPAATTPKDDHER